MPTLTHSQPCIRNLGTLIQFLRVSLYVAAHTFKCRKINGYRNNCSPSSPPAALWMFIGSSLSPPWNAAITCALFAEDSGSSCRFSRTVCLEVQPASFHGERLIRNSLWTALLSCDPPWHVSWQENHQLFDQGRLYQQLGDPRIWEGSEIGYGSPFRYVASRRDFSSSCRSLHYRPLQFTFRTK